MPPTDIPSNGQQHSNRTRLMIVTGNKATNSITYAEQAASSMRKISD
jgi:hypothetical protein